MPSDICDEIINGSRFSVRLLSIRDAKNLDESKLRAALQYACRPGRDADPRLQGLYFFGPSNGMSPARSITQSVNP